MQDIYYNDILNFLNNAEIKNTIIECVFSKKNQQKSEIQKIIYDKIYNKINISDINNKNISIDTKLETPIIKLIKDKYIVNEKENLINNIFNLIYSDDYYVDTDGNIQSLYGGYGDISKIEVLSDSIRVHTIDNITSYEKIEYSVLYTFLKNVLRNNEHKNLIHSISINIDKFSKILYEKVKEGSVFFQDIPFRDMYDTVRKGEKFYPIYNNYSLPYAFTLKFINSSKLEITSYKEADTVLVSMIDDDNNTITYNIIKTELVNRFKDIIKYSKDNFINILTFVNSKNEIIPNISIHKLSIKEFYALGILRKIKNYIDAIEKEFIEKYNIDKNVNLYIKEEYKKYKKDYLKKYYKYLKLLDRLKKEDDIFDYYINSKNKDYKDYKKYNINALLNFAKQNYTGIYAQYKNAYSNCIEFSKSKEMTPQEITLKVLFIGGSEDTKRLPNELIDRLDIDTILGLQNSIIIYNDYYFDEIDSGNIKYWSLYNQLNKADE